MTQELTHANFNLDIYNWTLGIQYGKIYSIKKVKMDRHKFIDCIAYLISCGEPILFTDNMDGIKKSKTFNDIQQEWEQPSISEINMTHAQMAMTPEARQKQKEYWENYWEQKNGPKQTEEIIDDLSLF